MKKKEIKELAQKPKEELMAMLRNYRQELLKLTLEKTVGKLKDSQAVNKKKHDIARIKTLINLK